MPHLRGRRRRAGDDQCIDAGSGQAGRCAPAAKENAACANHLPCEPGLYCSTTVDGKCVKKASLGQSCKAAEQCQAGIYCDSTDQRCVLYAGLGEACDTDHLCAATAKCSDGTCSLPTCAADAASM